MRSRIKRYRRPTLGLALIMAAATALAGAGNIFAQSAPDHEEAAVYIDLLPTGVGVALDALNLRGGYERTLSAGWYISAETGAYWAAGSSVSVFQADITAIARWRPSGPRGFFAGAGAGIAAAMVAAAPDLGGADSWNTFWLQSIAIAESGYSFKAIISPFSLEPFVRLIAALGPAISGGSEPGAQQGTKLSGALSASVGIRLNWHLSTSKN